MLRERGQGEDAERVRADELMPLVAALRTPDDSEAAITEKLNALFAIEAERVANAAVLADLLVPMLAEQLRPHATPLAVGTPVASRAGAMPATNSVPSAKPTPARGGSIADFIDDMIAQESPPPRPGHDSQRRAS